MHTIRYHTGDATAPAAQGNKIICHVCNDVGGWGKGFVVAISKRWPEPEAAYRAWYRDREHNDFALGAVQLVQVEPDLWVANMIGQQGMGKTKGVPPVRCEAVAAALVKLAALAKEKRASVHMPRIGCGLAGGKWEEIEPIIQRTLCTSGVEVLVYDLKTSSRGRHPPDGCVIRRLSSIVPSSGRGHTTCIMRIMGYGMRGCVIVASVVCAVAPTRADEDAQVLFQDQFRSKLADGWSWLREDAKHWRIGDGGLEVHVQPGNMWGPANDAKNVLLRPAPDPERQSLEITIALSNRPTSQYEQVDLVWYYDDGHMVKIGQELVDGKLSVVMGREENDKTKTISITPLDSTSVELRLLVKGKRIRGQFKTPKADWREVGECDLPIKGQPQVSLQFYQGPADVEHWARVTSLTIRGGR